ncbi:MAG: hypothetical protein U1F87_03145 [Kiritimatiellia bacterium]
MVLSYSTAAGLTDNTLDIHPDSVAAPAGLAFSINTTSNPGYVYVEVIPEAGTAGLFALGMLLLRRLRPRLIPSAGPAPVRGQDPGHLPLAVRGAMAYTGLSNASRLYNIRYGTGGKMNRFPLSGYLGRTTRHLDTLARFLNDLHPDIIGLVEVDAGSYRSRRCNQAEELAEELGHFHVYRSKYSERSPFAEWCPCSTSRATRCSPATPSAPSGSITSTPA